jgi:adrenodoxin-NADP+ reductase
MKLAIIGGGPSAFYVASRVLKSLPLPDIRVHIFDRLWAPHGLVRYGVAPDHPEVKACSLWLELGDFTDKFQELYP